MPTFRESLRTAVACIVALGLVFSNILLSDPASSVAVPASEKEYTLTDLREHHLDHVGNRISRAYPAVNYAVWCIDASLKFEQNKDEPMGLCYVKMPRAASTTLAGINKRIAVNFARRHGFTQSCIRHDGSVPGFYYRNRDRLSFLWTMVRDPVSRALSRVGYQYANRPGLMSNTSYVMSSLKNTDLHFGGTSEGRGGFQLQYSMTRVSDPWSAWNASAPEQIANPLGLQEQVERTLRAYNFIGVVERMDESLVAMQLLMGLDTSDVLAFSSKVAGTYEARRRRPGGRRQRNAREECVRLPKYVPSPDIRAYVRSDEWWAQHYGDYVMYAAVQRSLDKTIDSLGRKTFKVALRKYRQAKKKMESRCRPVFPCSSNGTLQTDESRLQCYAPNEGCGHRCIDDLFVHARRRLSRQPSIQGRLGSLHRQSDTP